MNLLKDIIPKIVTTNTKIFDKSTSSPNLSTNFWQYINITKNQTKEIAASTELPGIRENGSATSENAVITRISVF
jgi:hypothetical protein